MPKPGAVRPQYLASIKRSRNTHPVAFDADSSPAIETAPDEPDEIELGEEIERMVPLATAPEASPLVRDLKPPVVVSNVRLQPSTVEDIDQLWDWVRADHDGTMAFFGLVAKNSRALFEYVMSITGLENAGDAFWRSIRADGQLVGFVMLNPIIHTPGKQPVGTAHIYIEPSSQGRLAELLQPILQGADEYVPGVTLMVLTKREAWAALLEPLGFSRHIILSRPSSTHHPQE